AHRGQDRVQRCVLAEVGHLEAGGLEHRADHILPEVVQVTLDSAQDHAASNAGSTRSLHILNRVAEATTSGRNTSPRDHMAPSVNIALAMASCMITTG